MSLYYNYKVKNVKGIQYSLKGFRDYPYLDMNLESVKGIHKLGGCILGISHQDVDVKTIIQSLRKNRIN